MSTDQDQSVTTEPVKRPIRDTEISSRSLSGTVRARLVKKNDASEYQIPECGGHRLSRAHAVGKASFG